MEKRINHLSQLTDDVRIYVSTYNRYNNGSLQGYWLDIASFYDAEELINYCKEELFSDEDAPELMFQDFENFPEKFYSESMNEKDFDSLFEWLDLDEEQRNMCEEYWDEVWKDASIKDILNDYVYTGYAEDYYDELAEDALNNKNIPDIIRNCFDYKKWYDLCRQDYCETKNYLFVA